MRSGSVVILLIIVAAISAGATYVLTGDDESVEPVTSGLSIADNPTLAAQLTQIAQGSDPSIERFVTVEIPVTTTPDPNVIMVTVTPLGAGADAQGFPGDINAEGGEGEGEGGGAAVASGPRPASIDPELFDRAGRFIGTEDQLPAGCVLHTISDGEFPTLIIENYELPATTTFTMMAMNGLTEELATNLQIGDTLVVPLEGCPIDDFLAIQGQVTPGAEVAEAEVAEETPEVVATVDPNLTPSPTVPPTVTLAPTVAGATVQIINVIGAGDIRSEGVEIVNNGNTIDISGWTLSDGDGNVYRFPDQRRLFSGASVTVNTRVGDNTAILFFWGREDAVFGESGDVVVLADADGQVQSSLRLP